jgi:aryl-alcohol dehydrogenase-like predicted oxidoreductase
VDYETGLVAAREFGELVRAEAPAGTSSAQAAIAWLCQQPEVSSVIPGARSVGQARSNAAAGRVPRLGDAFEAGVRRIYDERLREDIHPRW